MVAENPSPPCRLSQDDTAPWVSKACFFFTHFQDQEKYRTLHLKFSLVIPG